MEQERLGKAYFEWQKYLFRSEAELTRLYIEWQLAKTLSQKEHEEQAAPLFRERARRRKRLLNQLLKVKCTGAFEDWRQERLKELGYLVIDSRN